MKGYFAYFLGGVDGDIEFHFNVVVMNWLCDLLGENAGVWNSLYL
jgi:hypothetical protein